MILSHSAFLIMNAYYSVTELLHKMEFTCKYLSFNFNYLKLLLNGYFVKYRENDYFLFSVTTNLPYIFIYISFLLLSIIFIFFSLFWKYYLKASSIKLTNLLKSQFFQNLNNVPCSFSGTKFNYCKNIIFRSFKPGDPIYLQIYLVQSPYI